MTYSDGLPITVQAELASAGNTIRMHSETISGELTRLRADVDNILAHWRGGTNQEFINLKAEWDAAATGLFDGLLTQIAWTMDVNWNNYQETELANKQTWMSR